MLTSLFATSPWVFWIFLILKTCIGELVNIGTSNIAARKAVFWMVVCIRERQTEGIDVQGERSMQGCLIFSDGFELHSSSGGDKSVHLCCRYCTLLQATMPHVPNVMPIEPKELLEFCSDAGYNCRLEPRGSWFTPPDYNVGMTDWERSLRLR